MPHACRARAGPRTQAAASRKRFDARTSVAIRIATALHGAALWPAIALADDPQASGSGGSGSLLGVAAIAFAAATTVLLPFALFYALFATVQRRGVRTPPAISALLS